MQIERNKNKKVRRFSKVYQERRRKLLGHIIRAKEDDPLRQVTLEKGKARPPNFGKKRVGKPRTRWADDALDRVWKEFRKDAPKRNSRKPNRKRKYKASHRQNEFIKKWAMERKF